MIEYTLFKHFSQRVEGIVQIGFREVLAKGLLNVLQCFIKNTGRKWGWFENQAQKLRISGGENSEFEECKSKT